ncbi:MAG: SH3 domain-containing protein [Betaproteobacteria bacterium]
MRRLCVVLTMLVVGVLPAASVSAASEFKSIGPGPAVMFDTPSAKGRKLFAAPAGMPVEIIINNGDWSRVRDAAGDLAWVENKSLSSKRMLLVESAQAIVRSSADEKAAVVFTANKGVLLELAEPVASSWLKVRHRDGDIGYAKASDVWGE